METLSQVANLLEMAFIKSFSHIIEQADPELTDLPASACSVLG